LVLDEPVVSRKIGKTTMSEMTLQQEWKSTDQLSPKVYIQIHLKPLNDSAIAKFGKSKLSLQPEALL
jgi:hypothetical protein